MHPKNQKIPPNPGSNFPKAHRRPWTVAKVVPTVAKYAYAPDNVPDAY